jgi:hypothetical protein
LNRKTKQREENRFLSNVGSSFYACEPEPELDAKQSGVSLNLDPGAWYYSQNIIRNKPSELGFGGY